MTATKRGYVLLEAGIGGAILAVSLSFAVSQLAAARAEVTFAAKHALAVSLARAKLDEAVSSLPAGIADQASFVPVGVGFPGLRWRWTTTDSAVGTNAAAGFQSTGVAKEVTVVVDFICARNSREDLAAAPAGDGRGEVTVVRLWLE